MTPDTDASIWADALDISRSFVVDGAAGTGKSELCLQRYLSLLANAQQPEEVLFLVGSEIQADRLRQAVTNKLIGTEPLSDRDEAVRKRDQELDWHIAGQPERLQIHTLATLSQLLVSAAPVSSGCGGGAVLTRDAESYYGTAARALLRTLDHDAHVAPNLETLLLHLDNDLVRCERLLAGLLRRRVVLQRCLKLDNPDANRKTLQSAIENAVATTLADVAAAIPEDCRKEVVELANAAARKLSLRSSDSPICRWRDLHDLPKTDSAHVTPWRGLCELLLDDDGQVRSKFGVAQGFAPADDADNDTERAARIELASRIEILSARLSDTPGFATRLAAVRDVTEVRYTHLQWTVLQSLLAVLPRAIADLTRAFRALGEMDLTEMVLGATRALQSGQAEVFGANGLQHLVVDDFHELSYAATHLVERLTAGWSDRLGKSLMITGNPFASVCRGDGAQPALYLNLQNRGLGQQKLEAIRLTNERRSSVQVSRWVNNTFAAVTANEVIGEGAMPLWECEPAEVRDGEVHLVGVAGGARAEAQYIATLLTEQPSLRDGRVGILLADSAYARTILDVLRDQGIACYSDNLDLLGQRPVIRDLHALTRALLHLADRIAWLTVLRAPWCGLTLSDLHKLVADAPTMAVWELIIDERRRSGLSEDGQQRLSRIKRVVAQTLAERGRRDLRRMVEGVWTALGGAVCVTNEYELQQTRDFFRMLALIDDGGEADSLEALDTAVQRLYSTHVTLNNAVSVSDIQHARNHVYDTVILAGLSSPIARPEEDDALRWLVRPDDSGQAQLLLAPVSPEGSSDPLNRWLEAMQAAYHDNELRRMVYVGATRAIDNLYVVTSPPQDASGWATPPLHSPLHAIWHAISEQIPDTPAVTMEESIQGVGVIRRLPSSWLLPEAPQPKVWHVTRGEDEIELGTLDGLGDSARLSAKIVSRVLADVASAGPTDWALRSLDGLENHLQRVFGMLGMREPAIPEAADAAGKAIRDLLENDRARWLLDNIHQDAHSPLTVTGWLDEELVSVVSDRSFVDKNGIRWLIEYHYPELLSRVDGLSLDDSILKAQPRLRRQARLLRRLDSAPVMTGVFFPFSAGWREWDPKV